MDIPVYVWGVCSVTLTVCSLGPYVWRTLRGLNRPHIFTWIIWALLTGMAFAVQFTSGAGSGSWATGITALMCCLVVLVSIRHGEKTITRLDWLSFVSALLILPIWLLTKNPALAAVLVTVIDGLGYIPTFRKVWSRPHEEMASTHALQNVKHVLSMLGMEKINMGTSFYPVCVFLFNAVLVALILVRRSRIQALIRAGD